MSLDLSQLLSRRLEALESSDERQILSIVREFLEGVGLDPASISDAQIINKNLSVKATPVVKQYLARNLSGLNTCFKKHLNNKVLVERVV